MKKNFKKIPVSVLLMFVAAIALLVVSTVGGARAALTYYSDTYRAQFDMYHIGVTLNEYNNAEAVGTEEGRTEISWRNYVSDPQAGVSSDQQWIEHTGELLTWVGAGENPKFKIGEKMNENLTVGNTGSIDEYVRVIIYRYWEKDGKKLTYLDPGLIELDLNIEESDGYQWIKGAEPSNGKERIVLYLNKPLPVNAESHPFLTGVTVSSDVYKYVTKEQREKHDNITVVSRQYAYDGAQFKVEVEVDGVQTHNAPDAIKAAWGKTVSEPAADGSISW